MGLAEWIHSEITFTQSEIQVFPNPVVHTLKVGGVAGKSSTITIRNARGKLIQTTANRSSINVAHLPNGWYFVQVNTNGNVTTHKIFVYK